MRLSEYRIKKIRKSVRRILIVYWGAFGDCLTTTPLLEALSKYFNRPHITYVLGRGADLSQNASRLIELNPYVDRYINSSISILSDVLMDKPYDLAIDMCASGTSQTISKLSGAKIRLWGRYREIPTHFLYSDSLGGNWSQPLKVNVDQYDYRVRTNLKLAEFLGFKTKAAAMPKIYFSAAERRFGEECLRKLGGDGTDMVIAIHPGGRDPGRLWKTANYALLADMLIEKYNAKILVFYGPREKHFAERVSRLSKHLLFKMHEKDIRRYASIIAGCDLFISSDGGPLQIALASGIPSIGIFKSEAVKNAMHWYDHKKRIGLFCLFARLAKHSKRNLKAKTINRRDRKEVNLAVKRAGEALRFKDDARAGV